MQGQRKQETQGAESIDSYIRASSMPSRGEYPRGIRLDTTGYDSSGGSPMEFPDRGSRELDKRGVLMGSVGGAGQLDHARALGKAPLAFSRPGVWR